MAKDWKYYAVDFAHYFLILLALWAFVSWSLTQPAFQDRFAMFLSVLAVFIIADKIAHWSAKTFLKEKI